MTYVYLDTETTGLDPYVHEVWEIAYAVDDGPILSAFVSHRLATADGTALDLNGYTSRFNPALVEALFDAQAKEDLAGATLVGANPAFDAGFLRHRWRAAPWHHRLLDVETYAMPALGLAKPAGLAGITARLREMGHDIPEPDHTAAADVATVRACHLALRDIYAHHLDQPAPTRKALP